jgi:hypothetical protein
MSVKDVMDGKNVINDMNVMNDMNANHRTKIAAHSAR